MTDTLIRLDRNDDLPLEFDGRLIADQSTRFDPPVSTKTSVRWNSTEGRNRWSELRLYATASGKWVIELVGESVEPGEETFRNVVVCDNPAALVPALRRLVAKKKQPLPTFVLDALDEAVAQDDRLTDLLVERI